MGKVLKIVLVVVVVAALVVVAQPALAGLIAGKFTAAFGAIGLGAKLASMAIISLAAGLASQLIMGKPKEISNSALERLNVSVDPTAPRRIVFGKTAAGLDERFHEKVEKSGGIFGITLDDGIGGSTFKKKGDYFYRVVALASHKIHKCNSVWLEDELSFNGTNSVGKYTKENGLAIAIINEGTTANGERFGSGNYWKDTASFTGCAYMKMRQRLDQDVYPNGLPTKMTVIVDGCPVYDPRLDGSNLGSGTHRPDDQTTWSFMDGSKQIGRNPALALLTYLIGWRINGKLAWGMGIPVSRIDLGNFITYANLCEESVTSAGGGTTQRYTHDAIYSTNDNHQTILNTITACMGTTKFVDTGGMYQLVGGMDDLDGPVMTFTQDDMIGQYEWKPAAPTRESYNIVRGRYTNPVELYQLEDYGEIEIAPLADGIPRTLVLELPGITRAETAQRIAKQSLIRNRFAGTFSATFMPAGFSVEVGSLVRMVLPQEGWAQPGKLFRVISQEESAEMVFSMTLQEEDPTIYAFDSSEVIPLPEVIRPPSYDPTETAPIEDLAATSEAVTLSNGAKQSQITVTWTDPEASVASVAIEVSTDSTKWTEVAGSFDSEAEQFVFNSPLSGESTQVRMRNRMMSGIYGPYSTVTVTAAQGSGVPTFTGYLTDESVTFAADSNGNIL